MTDPAPREALAAMIRAEVERQLLRNSPLAPMPGSRVTLTGSVFYRGDDFRREALGPVDIDALADAVLAWTREREAADG